MILGDRARNLQIATPGFAARGRPGKLTLDSHPRRPGPVLPFLRPSSWLMIHPRHCAFPTAGAQGRLRRSVADCAPRSAPIVAMEEDFSLAPITSSTGR